MTCRAVRGAITVEKNSVEAVESAAAELLLSIVQANKIKIPDIVSVIFSVSVDLNAQFPAVAARKLGWKYVPLLCTYELDVKGSLRKCLRVLLTYNTRAPQNKIQHQYLGGAAVLRPDLADN